MKVIGIIPSRYNSTRFPGKPLADINGKSMIQRVYEQCIKSSRLDEVVVATDDNRILSHVKQFGGKAIITSSIHTTGTERCSEASKKLSNEFVKDLHAPYLESQLKGLNLKQPDFNPNTLRITKSESEDSFDPDEGSSVAVTGMHIC